MKLVQGRTLRALIEAGYVQKYYHDIPTYFKALLWLNERKYQISIIWEIDHYKVDYHYDGEQMCLFDLNYKRFENQEDAIVTIIDWLADNNLIKKQEDAYI